MKFLTAEEAKIWCDGRALNLTADMRPYYEGNPQCFTIGLEEKASRVIVLADYLIPTWNDVHFSGALLWIRERGIWGDFSEKVGAIILEHMRRAQGERATVEERPGHLFGPQELLEMHSYFLLPMLFGWDAFLVSEDGDYFIFVSHDGVAEVVARNPETTDLMRQHVKDWNPREGRSYYQKPKP